jgi:tripartite-type tricarboxylate transporter receptor subunit TctC
MTSLVSVVPLVMVVAPVGARRAASRNSLRSSRRAPAKSPWLPPAAAPTNHLGGELFQAATGTRMIHVPYKGSGPALVDLMGGQVDVHFDQLSSAIGAIQGGKLRALAVTTLKRSAQLPEVPTIDESGVPGFDASTFTGIVLPAATPRDVVTRLHASLVKVLRAKATRDSFARLGAETLESTPEEFARFVREDLAKWSKVVRDAGIKLD